MFYCILYVHKVLGIPTSFHWWVTVLNRQPWYYRLWKGDLSTEICMYGRYDQRFTLCSSKCNLFKDHFNPGVKTVDMGSKGVSDDRLSEGPSTPSLRNTSSCPSWRQYACWLLCMDLMLAHYDTVALNDFVVSFVAAAVRLLLAMLHNAHALVSFSVHYIIWPTTVGRLLIAWLKVCVSTFSRKLRI